VGSNPAGRANFLQQLQRPAAFIAPGRFTSVGTLVGNLGSNMLVKWFSADGGADPAHASNWRTESASLHDVMSGPLAGRTIRTDR
jgi:hypothetical protein